MCNNDNININVWNEILIILMIINDNDKIMIILIMCNNNEILMK